MMTSPLTQEVVSLPVTSQYRLSEWWYIGNILAWVWTVLSLVPAVTLPPALPSWLKLQPPLTSIRPQKEQQCRWRPAGNLSKAHCPCCSLGPSSGVHPPIPPPPPPSTRSSNIHHPPPLGRPQAGLSSGKATSDGAKWREPSWGGREEMGWKDGKEKIESKNETIRGEGSGFSSKFKHCLIDLLQLIVLLVLFPQSCNYCVWLAVQCKKD